MPSSTSLGYTYGSNDVTKVVVQAPLDILPDALVAARRCQGRPSTRERLVCSGGIVGVVAFALSAIVYLLVRE